MPRKNSITITRIVNDATGLRGLMYVYNNSIIAFLGKNLFDIVLVVVVLIYIRRRIYI